MAGNDEYQRTAIGSNNRMNRKHQWRGVKSGVWRAINVKAKHGASSAARRRKMLKWRKAKSKQWRRMPAGEK